MIMKKILLIGAAVLAVLLSATFITYAIMPKDDDHVLKEQWKKFESARNSDLPKKEIQILNEIKAATEKIPGKDIGKTGAKNYCIYEDKDRHL